jgi:hypothetical protein
LGGAVVKTRRRGAICCDDGLEVIAFPPLFLTVPVRGEGSGGRNLFGLIDGGFLEVSAVHHGEGRGVGGQQLVLISSDWSLCRASFR